MTEHKWAVVAWVCAGAIMAPASDAQGAPEVLHQTSRARTRLREGPGAYFPLVAELPPGTKLKETARQRGWAHVEASGTKGWVALRSLTKLVGASSSDGSVISGKRRPVSKSSVAAAIRGLAIRSGVGAKPMVNVVMHAMHDPTFSPGQFREFQRLGPALAAVPSRLRREALPEYEPTLEDDGVGVAVAARILRDRLETGTKRARYVRLLTAYLAEASGVYEHVRFVTFILKDPVPNAVSAPGAFIFINSGLLDLVRDESELAGVIAHEIMHVTRRHGMQEKVARADRFRSEGAFAELDDSTGGASAVEQELEAVALEAYDFTVKPRLQEYEVDADRRALILLASAGYDPAGLARAVGRVRTWTKGANVFSEAGNPFQRMDLKARIAKLEELRRRNLSEVRGSSHADRFGKWMK